MKRRTKSKAAPPPIGKRVAAWLADERICISIGVFAGVFWFMRNFLLPADWNGRICCDSTEYIKAAGWLRSPSDIFTYLELWEYGHKAPSYPWFLAIHREIVHALGLWPAVDWVSVSLFTVLVLYFLASIFLYRTARLAGLKIHPLALTALLLHPGLISYAALPLTDTFSTMLVMFGIGAVARATLIAREPRRSLVLSAAGGSSLALAVLSRPNLLPAVYLFLVAWLGLALLRARSGAKGASLRLALAPLAGIIACAVTVSPQYIACSVKYGGLCFQSPAYGENGKNFTLKWGLDTPRVYSMLNSRVNSKGLIRVQDPYLTAVFSDCTIVEGRAMPSLLSCFASHAGILPIYFGKKLIGLFDNFHLNAYATNITQGWERAWNRLFSAIDFMGFAALSGMIAFAALRRRLNEPWVLALLFPFIYGWISSLVHIEGRYGFQAVPFCVLAFAWAVANSTRRVTVALGLAGLLFLVQVSQWDAIDPMKVEDVRDLRPTPIDRSLGEIR